MRSQLFISALILAFFLSPIGVFGYSGGSGTLGDPYLIAATSDLQDLMNTPGDWSAHFMLTSDIDASTLGAPAPIGNNTTKFTGSFNGQNHVISNLVINGGVNDYQGLFGYMDGATISNLGVENLNVGGDALVGGLCGQNDGGSITGCHTTGTVTGTFEIIGGLVGQNKGGTISDSYSECTVTVIGGSSRIAGGFCGLNSHNGSITDSHATGDVSVTGKGDAAGGFLGDNGIYETNNPGEVDNCYATGTVTADGEGAGGFVARNRPWSNISNSFATGDVTGQWGVGGFVGFTQVQNPGTQIPGIITQCYALGNVASTGTDSGNRGYVGGFVGRNQDGSEIRECFAVGDAVSAYHTAGGFAGGNTAGTSTLTKCYAVGDAYGPQGYNGGFVGWNEGRISYSFSTGAPSGGSSLGGFCGSESGGTYVCNFWNTETSGFTDGFDSGNMAGVTGVNTAVMQNEATFTGCFDFSNDWVLVDYPELKWYDDVHPRPSVILALAGSPFSENGGVATITAILSNTYKYDVTVNLAFSGTAAINVDYTPSAESINITSMNTSGSVDLTGNNRGTVEGKETVIVDIQSVINGTENGTQQVTATILPGAGGGLDGLQSVPTVNGWGFIILAAGVCLIGLFVLHSRRSRNAVR